MCWALPRRGGVVNPPDPGDPGSSDPPDPGPTPGALPDILGVQSFIGRMRINQFGLSSNVIPDDIDYEIGANRAFSNHPLFKNITEVEFNTKTQSNQKFIKIPKFYYKAEKTDKAHSYKLWLSATQQPGFKIHPAFMKNGSEINEFYVAKYMCGGEFLQSIPGVYSRRVKINDIPSLISSIHGENFVSWDIYQLSAIRMLTIIDYGTTYLSHPPGGPYLSVQTDSNHNVLNGGAPRYCNYRNIHELWKCGWQFVDGIKGADGGRIHVFKTDGSREYVNTGHVLEHKMVTVNADSYFVWDLVFGPPGDGYDFSSIFIHKTPNGHTIPFTTSDEIIYPIHKNDFVYCSGGNNFIPSTTHVGGVFGCKYADSNNDNSSGAYSYIRLAKL